MSRRFFIDADLAAGNSLEMGRGDYAEELKHMRKALRLNAGARVLLVNGLGFEADAEILALDADAASFQVQEVRKLERERPRIVLAQGLLKGQRMDWLVEKATELQIAEITAVATKHSVPSEQEAGGRSLRWQRLARSALKQCAGAFLPDIVGPLDLPNFLASWKDSALKIVLHPDSASPPLLTVLSGSAKGLSAEKIDRICLFTGPEGGLHSEEMLELKGMGFRPASLGDSILRGETAGLVAIAVAKQWALAHNYG